ncbi:copper chaperone PCu(A)C [Streptomyces sp. NPDC090022]|uniref:copper chaperone PCu(A)C n=1 Tax=Streptomyces sp. NPDC090022 TaxID=3365920 RepID=UPI00381A9A63
MSTSRRPADRRRLPEGLSAVVAPVAACAVALGSLTVWAGAGYAGSPPRLDVTDGRIWVSFGDTPYTSAYFRLTNSGGSDDRLVKVTLPGVTDAIGFSGHRMLGANTATDEKRGSIAVPAGRTVTMSPSGVNVTVPSDRTRREGDILFFTLHFERGGPMEVPAVVVRPGS